MRHSAHIIVAILIATWTTTTASAQQVVGETIVGSRVISDVAVGETAGSARYPKPTMKGASHSYATEGYVEGTPTGDGNVEYVDGGYVEADASGRVVRGSGRLHYLAHGGEQGPHIPKQYAQPDLFYNYYSNGQNQVNAEMYLSPGPVPPFVGNTWVPYQPYMPHNYLYQHTDLYHNHYDYGRGTNRTKASYRVAPKQYAQTLYNVFRIAR